METHSRIGILNNDGTIDAIYCHYDGYESHHLPILKSYYDTTDKVKELISLGALSSLDKKINPITDSHSFDNPEKDVVVAYHRDRGEELSIEHIDSDDAFCAFLDGEYSYYYLFIPKVNAWVAWGYNWNTGKYIQA